MENFNNLMKLKKKWFTRFEGKFKLKLMKVTWSMSVNKKITLYM